MSMVLELHLPCFADDAVDGRVVRQRPFGGEGPHQEATHDETLRETLRETRSAGETPEEASAATAEQPADGRHNLCTQAPASPYAFLASPPLPGQRSGGMQPGWLFSLDNDVDGFGQAELGSSGAF